MTLKNRSGFTLLEIIIVIIIVGVLASLALPRFFRTVEFSRSTEALSGMSAIRQSLERCYLMNSGTYVGCTLDDAANVNTLDLQSPGTSPGTLFTYAVANQSATGYTITATRNAANGGDGTSTVTITQTAANATRAGTGQFAGIR